MNRFQEGSPLITPSTMERLELLKQIALKWEHAKETIIPKMWLKIKVGRVNIFKKWCCDDCRYPRIDRLVQYFVIRDPDDDTFDREFHFEWPSNTIISINKLDEYSGIQHRYYLDYIPDYLFMKILTKPCGCEKVYMYYPLCIKPQWTLKIIVQKVIQTIIIIKHWKKLTFMPGGQGYIRALNEFQNLKQNQNG